MKLNLIKELTLKGLTNQEIRVALMSIEGLQNSEIADRLFITEKLIKTHLDDIFRKLDINKLVDLKLWAIVTHNCTELLERFNEK